jgi:hypothetical protein
MPTVLRFEGFNIVIYPADHAPSHVHIFGAASEAIFNLNCPQGPVVLRENYGFSRRDVSRIRKFLDENVRMLCCEWRRIHGQG